MDHRQGSGPRPRTEDEGGKSEVDSRRPWLRLLDEIQEPDCADAIGDRVEQLLWILDHLDDIDADFLAIYRIDLERDEITARRYFALAHRLPAYQGVMATRVDEERDEHNPSATPTRTSSTPAPTGADGETREVSLTAFRMQFPGLVSMGGGAGGG
ncbi:hypothetical protein ACIA6D_23605 [Streptomyces cacaoi]